jgi:hypothetical protein
MPSYSDFKYLQKMNAKYNSVYLKKNEGTCAKKPEGIRGERPS